MTPARTGSPALPGRGQAVQLIDTCLVDCIWCGDHNRLLAVTSGGVVSRCLRCGDHARLTQPPSWCPRLRKAQSGRDALHIADPGHRSPRTARP